MENDLDKNLCFQGTDGTQHLYLLNCSNINMQLCSDFHVIFKKCEAFVSTTDWIIVSKSIFFDNMNDVLQSKQ